MDDVSHGKQFMVDEQDLAVLPNKRSKEEKEKSPHAEVSKQEVNHF